MALPDDFASLSLGEQLLAVTDLERVGYREPAVIGVSPLLDTYAEDGAKARTDPGFPDSNSGEASNWYGGPPSTLMAEFEWLYDDGYNSGNIDCTAPGAPGCWGHRLGLLGRFDQPIFMGAADIPSELSVTTLLAGNEFWNPVFGANPTPAELTHHPLTPTWVQIARTVPLVLPKTVRLNTLAGHDANHLIVVWSPAAWQEAHFRVDGGGGVWATGPKCPLESGGKCGIVVSFRPRKPGVTTATLVAYSDAGIQRVELVGIAH